MGTTSSTGKGTKVPLVCEKGGKRNLELKGKRVGYSDGLRNKLFHNLLC